MDAASASATDSDHSTVPAMNREDTAPTEATSTSKSSSTVTDHSSDSNIANSYADDMDLLQQAETQVTTERYLAAARLLRRVSDTSLLQPQHERVLKMADEAQEVLDTLLQYPSDDDTNSWKKQGESHGHRDTAIHYQVDEKARLTCRIETPIEESMLVPILSVFNESELYATWMPSWRFPRVQVKQSVKLAEYGRGNQVIQVKVQMPRLIADRQVVQHAFAVDDIDESEVIVVKIQSCPTGPFQYALEQDDNVNDASDNFDDVNVDADESGNGNNDGNENDEAGIGDDGKGLQIPPAAKGVTRVDMDAGLLIRSCPTDHPLLVAAAEKKAKAKKPAASSYPVGEKLLLLSVTQYVDAHVMGVPTSMINFFTRTVIGSMWGSMLQVAEDVRDGKRPQHAEAIQAKTDLYDWVNDRVQVMFHKMEQREEAAGRSKVEGEDKAQAENVETDNVEAETVERSVAKEEVKKVDNLDEGYYNTEVEEQQEESEVKEKQQDEGLHEDQADSEVKEEQPDEEVLENQVKNEVEEEQPDEEVHENEVDNEVEEEQPDEEVHENQVDNEVEEEQPDEELEESQVDNEVEEEHQDEELDASQEDHGDQVDPEVEAIEKDEELDEDLDEDPSEGLDEDLDEDPSEGLDEDLDEDPSEGLDQNPSESQEPSENQEPSESQEPSENQEPSEGQGDNVAEEESEQNDESTQNDGEKENA
jgi:hypothetical protein